MRIFYLLLLVLWLAPDGRGQSFYFGNDLSYVNEMEDCGVVYRENAQPADPYQLYAAHGCNLVRLRLWHTPSWYDALNKGRRYSDLNDVRKSILRAKAAGMQVLLDFHLSDNWADPAKQVAPAAWLPVVNDLPRLKDSLFQYVYKTLTQLNAEGLLPEMVQIGNETNRGILLSPQQNAAGWTLDWNRNSQLFKEAIRAVREAEKSAGKKIQVALHVAGPADTEWLIAGFWKNGVTDFDVIGISYYWAWHKPTTISQTGALIAKLRGLYPGKKVMIFETGYIWTTKSNDAANNIISETHPDYSPASPEAQAKWLIALTREAIAKGASGVIYWESAWVSSPCYTQWGQGSHQEHAAFFDFNNNLMPQGGMSWMEQQYPGLSGAHETPPAVPRLSVVQDSSRGRLLLHLEGRALPANCRVALWDGAGRILSLSTHTSDAAGTSLASDLPAGTPPGIYVVSLHEGDKAVAAAKIWLK